MAEKNKRPFDKEWSMEMIELVRFLMDTEDTIDMVRFEQMVNDITHAEVIQVLVFIIAATSVKNEKAKIAFKNKYKELLSLL